MIIFSARFTLCKLRLMCFIFALAVFSTLLACAENTKDPNLLTDAGVDTSFSLDSGDPGLSDGNLDDDLEIYLNDTTVFNSNGNYGTDERLEAQFTCEEGHVLTGVGARAWAENITTLRVRCHKLNADGTLSSPSEHRAGTEPDKGLEVTLDAPEGHVVVGIGARGIEYYDVGRMALWTRPVLENGELGEVQQFFAGKADSDALEVQHQVEDDRVVVGFGLRMSWHDISELKVVSQKWNIR